jgi:predicted nucleic acid-binding protein
MIYLDTNIIVYAIENHPQYGRPCTAILEAVEAKRVEVCASVLVLIELVNVLVKINRLLSKAKKSLVKIVDSVDAVLSLPVVWFDLDPVVIRHAAQYTFNTVGIDYFHVASMELHSVSEILSADQELDQIPFIRRLDPLKYQP